MSHQCTWMYHVILYSFLSFYFSSQIHWQAGVRELQPSRSRPTDGIPCRKKVNRGNESQPGQVLTPESMDCQLEHSSHEFSKRVDIFFYTWVVSRPDQICWNNPLISWIVGDDSEACVSRDGSPSSDMTFEPDGTIGAISEAFMYFSRRLLSQTKLKDQGFYYSSTNRDTMHWAWPVYAWKGAGFFGQFIPQFFLFFSSLFHNKGAQI